jgi:beta-glucosidase
MVYNARKYGYNSQNQYDPLYPFGYGLSYTSFEYSNLECNDTVYTGTGVDISVEVKNTGNYHGREIVQLFIRDVFASVTRPLKSLKGFTEVELAPNQSETVTIHLSKEELSILDEDLTIKEEPRDIVILISNLSKTIQLRDK